MFKDFSKLIILCRTFLSYFVRASCVRHQDESFVQFVRDRYVSDSML